MTILARGCSRRCRDLKAACGGVHSRTSKTAQSRYTCSTLRTGLPRPVSRSPLASRCSANR
jgi:hypothetical protein